MDWSAEATNLTLTMLPTCPQGAAGGLRVGGFGTLESIHAAVVVSATLSLRLPLRAQALPRACPVPVPLCQFCVCACPSLLQASCSPPRCRVGHLHTGTQSLIHTLMTTNTSTTSSSTDRKPCGTRPHFTTHRRACGHQSPQQSLWPLRPRLCR